MKFSPTLTFHGRIVRSIAVACLGLLLAACAGMGLKSAVSRGDLESWARSNGYQAEAIPASPYLLFTLLRQRRPDPVLVIYIEGDGDERPTPFKPREPTPKMAQALRLAHQDVAPVVAYLARPCQYREEKSTQQCDSQFWVEPRYSAEVLDSMNTAVDQLKARTGAERVGLIGYGGGGVIATLLAGRRTDVAELVTVVAPLALTEWGDSKRLTPFWAVLDPKGQLSPAKTFPATHFVGGKDEIVPPRFTASFVSSHGGELIYIDSFDHSCCWADEWPWLLERARRQETTP